MSKINAVKKIILEDFPQQKQWIGKLIQPINQFFEQIYFAVAGGLTHGDNLKSKVYTGTVAVGQVIDLAHPIKFAWTLNQAPTEVRLGYIREVSGSPSLIGTYSFEWFYDNNGTLYVWITGLSTSKSYTITVIGQV